ncbi:BgTH12-00021 [Blumeria graminis f. sp. triticale]|uniref:BgtE-20069b n=2 Tax=Blumeria graminis TaxID=34373 RepID=A0A9X9QF30_BLUGR|nr:BgTH12-00021 [Blumeria graminis f. sp. triticale]VDB92447.1 BgtE-20069b [Blumeria graminis f. sp. tritici]
MKIVLPHLAIALLSIVAPALAVIFDCSGVIINGDVVRRVQATGNRASISKSSFIHGDSTRTYEYFDIHPNGQYSRDYTGFACFSDTSLPKPDVREHREDAWWPCSSSVI